MKRQKGKLFVAGILLASVLVSYAAKREDVDLYQWSIRGTVVNATAAQLNQLATGEFTINNATVRTNVNVGGVLVVTGNITNTALTASLPVFTDANKKLVSGTIGAGMTNVMTTSATVLAGVAVASEVEVLDSITPSVAAAVTGLGSATVAPAVTNAMVGGGVLSGVDIVVTNVVVSSSAFVYLDGASNIVTNTFVTAVTFETGTAVVSAPTITLETGDMVTAYGSPTTANFVNGITSNVVTAAKTLSTTTDSVIDSITPQTATFAKP